MMLQKKVYLKILQTETLVLASCTIMTVCIMLIALYLFEHAIKAWHLFLSTFRG